MNNFNEYLNYDVNKQLKIIEKIELTNDQIERIKRIKDIDLLVFAEIHCPDCKAMVAILEKFCQINDGINIKYLTRVDNRDKLLSLSNEGRIPTIVYKNKVILSEIPNFIKNEMNVNNYDEIKYNFRIGKYNKEIINWLIKELEC